MINPCGRTNEHHFDFPNGSEQEPNRTPYQANDPYTVLDSHC